MSPLAVGKIAYRYRFIETLGGSRARIPQRKYPSTSSTTKPGSPPACSARRDYPMQQLLRLPGHERIDIVQLAVTARRQWETPTS